MSAEAQFKKGDTVEGYRVLEVLGAGAASWVYLVQDPKTKQIWALKHVRRDGPKDDRFLEQAMLEYDIAKNLDHPGVRKIVRQIKKTKNFFNVTEVYLVMEMLDGVSMDQKPPATFEEAVDIFHQIADAMRHMHERGYVHADMKPNNVMLCRDDRGNALAKIIDLGQSCKSGTVKPRIQGTPDYIAPEQVHRRPITHKTDIYNLGATMYWTLTRQNIPTALAKGDSLLSRLDDELMPRPKPASELNPRIPTKLNELIMQCVEIEPAMRPDSMFLVCDRLSLILGMVRARAEEAAKRGGNASNASGAGLIHGSGNSSVLGVKVSGDGNTQTGK